MSSHSVPRHESSRDAAPSASDRRPVRHTSKSLHSGRARHDLVYLDWHEDPAHASSGSASTSEASRVTDEEVALVFEKVPVAHVQEIYRGFLTECPDAVSLAMQFPHRRHREIRSLSLRRTHRPAIRPRSPGLDREPSRKSARSVTKWAYTIPDFKASAEPLRRVSCHEVGGLRTHATSISNCR